MYAYADRAQLTFTKRRPQFDVALLEQVLDDSIAE
jgi:hypothetical protein